MPACLKTLTCLLAMLLLAPLAKAEQAQAIEPYEAWFVLNMGGQKAGHMHVTLKQDGDTLVSTSAMRIAIKRGQAEIMIEQSSLFVETLDYKPVVAESSMSLGAMATKQKLEFTGEKWKLTTGTAGQENVGEVDPPEAKWLTPGALSVALAAALERGDEEISVSTLDLSMGVKPVAMTMKRGEKADIEVFGKVVPATRWTMTMSAMPGMEIEQWTDDAGQPVRQVVPMLPGMEMEMLLADKQLALAKFDAPEMLAASLIEPDKRIKNPRTLKRGVYELSSANLKNNIGQSIPNDGYQSAKWLDDNTLRVEINLDKRSASKAVIDDVYLSASSTLNYKDPAVKKLIDAVLVKEHVAQANGVTLTAPIAMNLRMFVREHIDEKDLSVGFATASETARTGQGDCTEHACLLAAMLRGANIPSRTVTGLVYADQFAGREGVFGFHMWTQAWIATTKDEGYWLDLDAAAPGEINGFDATHIALSTSSMKDGETFNDMVTLLPMMAGLKIKVIELEWAEE